MKRRIINLKKHKNGHLALKYLRMVVAISLLSYVQVFSQKITITSSNTMSIKEVLKEVENQSDYTFIYDNTKVDVTQLVSIDARDMELEKVLDKLFESYGIEYKIKDNQIILDTELNSRQTGEEITVSGTVTSAIDNEPLPGVNVYVKGTAEGTITDIDGNYSLDVPSGSVLVYSFIGYLSEEISVGTQGNIDVVLIEDIAQLDEVVVIGYGTVKKRDLTGAMASLKEEDLNKGFTGTPEDLFKGRVAGVRIQSNSGEPGAASQIRIRGVNSIRTNQQPLFVVDGVPLDMQNIEPESAMNRGSATSPFQYINPDDIASIDILKDASASAIYGSRGANGVILITTKSGEAGKTAVTYSGSFSLSKIPKIIDVLDADEFIAARDDIYEGTGNEEYTEYHYGANTNWQEEVLRTAKSQKHHLSFTGGVGESSYYGSVGYLKQEGILKNSDLENFNARFNLTQKALNDRINVQTNLTVSNIKQHRLPIMEQTGAPGDLLIQAIQANPTMPVYDTTGEYFQMRGIYNPVAMLDYDRNETKTTRVIGSFTPSVEILKNLVYKVNIGIDHSNSIRREDRYSDLQDANGMANSSIRQHAINNYVIENTMNYSLTLANNHIINVLAGHSYQKVLTEYMGTWSTNVQNDEQLRPSYNIETADENPSYSGATLDEMQSYFGRVHYSFMGKYLLTASLRRDGSSKFGENNKYGNFPSFAAAWTLSEEGFIRSLNIFDNLKIRAGWGKIGNSEIGRGHSSFALDSNPFSTGILNGTTDDVIYGLVLTRTTNRDIQWEATASTNVGIDFGVLNNRVYGSVDIYNKKTENMLLRVNAKQPAPTPYQIVNLKDGEVTNKGVEISLSGVVLSKSDMSLTLTGNFTRNRNEMNGLKITRIMTGAANGQGMSDVNVQAITNGYPINEFYGYRFLGWDEEGFGIYQQGTPDPETGEAEDTLVYLGSPHPDFFWGLNIEFRYKIFTLTAFLEGVQGQLIYNNTANSIATMGNLNNARNTFPSTVETGENVDNDIRFSNRFLEDGSYIRLSDVTLSCAVPVEKIKAISQLNLFVKGTNVLLITDYTGYDPEINSDASVDEVNSINVDNSSYPKARTITFGANITF
ncbi:MAG: TonB-dependent receptor [Bacteroidales bacterium]|nr:TonB-dependent receptor [Bacteroidales bacterium]